MLVRTAADLDYLLSYTDARPSAHPFRHLVITVHAASLPSLSFSNLRCRTLIMTCCLVSRDSCEFTFKLEHGTDAPPARAHFASVFPPACTVDQSFY